MDTLIVTSESNKLLRNRITDYLPHRFPVGLDVFPYTEEEVDRLSFPLEAAQGKVIWQRT